MGNCESRCFQILRISWRNLRAFEHAVPSLTGQELHPLLQALSALKQLLLGAALMALLKTESLWHHHPSPSFALPCSTVSLVLIASWHVSYFVSPLHTHTALSPQRRQRVLPVLLAAVYPQHSQPVEVSQILFVAWKNESLTAPSPNPRHRREGIRGLEKKLSTSQMRKLRHTEKGLVYDLTAKFSSLAGKNTRIRISVLEM